MQMDRQSDLDRGRAAGRRFGWAEAYQALSSADRASPLGADDLHLLATAAYLLGKLPESVAALRRSYESHVKAGQPRRSARAVFWIAYALGSNGETAQAAGWLARAVQLLESQPPDCAEQGLVVGAMAFRAMDIGEYDEARQLASQAAEIGRRTGDSDVRGLALTQAGSALVRLGRAEEAMALLDEAMVAVVSAEISPIAAGTVYCSVISLCQELAELRRAQEWTEALTSWCGKQPDMLMFSGQCMVHRAELLQLHGRWPEAVAEAEQAWKRFAEAPHTVAAGAARYRQAEIHRVSGDVPAAERAYRQASECGQEACPGLALLRMAQGDTRAAVAAMRRVLGETTDPLRRARLLPAQVEITVGAGDLAAARQAADELTATATRYATPALRATAEHARGEVALADGDPAGALTSLRAAATLWRELKVPYEAARVRVLIALACRELGDDDNARLELEAAGRVFAQLGARPDQARVSALAGQRPEPSHNLTGREMEVLRLVATGMTNQAIARHLTLSEKTVERHLSNLFGKLRVTSRSAATAYAYQHRLVS